MQYQPARATEAAVRPPRHPKRVSVSAPQLASAETATSRDGVAAGPDDGGVEVLIQAAKDAVDDERARGHNLDTKTIALTTAAGALLTLNATLGRPLLAADVGAVGQALVQGFFAVACVALFSAAAIAMLGVLKPRGYRGLGRKDVRDFYEDTSVQALSATEVRRRLLGTYADVLDHDRLMNDRKAKLVKIAIIALAAGLLAVTGQAMTLFGREIGL